MTGEALKELEAAILDAHQASERSPEAIFVLGSPRTGSTVIYQACCALFRLPYIANLTNDLFYETPIVGLAIQKAMPVSIAWTSRFGKTTGAFQPSEGSAVMAEWFGGGHPSQIASASILAGREEHFLRSLSAVQGLFGEPLVIKNSWNCFRLAYLANVLHRARFLWVRRDITDAALSDLEARYVTKGSPDSWNSATPTNYKALMTRPPSEQVVENQYEFNRAVGNDLKAHAAGRFTEIWYEDFVANARDSLASAGAGIGLKLRDSSMAQISLASTHRRLQKGDVEAVSSYVLAQGARMVPYRYQPGTKARSA